MLDIAAAAYTFHTAYRPFIRSIPLSDPKFVLLASELTMAWLGNQHNRINADDVPAFLRQMHSTVERLAGGTAVVDSGSAPEEAFTPAVTVRKSLADPNFIISLIDGKPYKTLKRHLAINGLTADQYRERYGLKDGYPVVAPAYAALRSDMAKKIGLGGKRTKKAVEAAGGVVDAVAAPVKAVAKRAKKTISEAKQAAKDHLG